MCVGWGLGVGQELACQIHANGTSRSAAQKSSRYYERAQGVVVIITVNWMLKRAALILAWLHSLRMQLSGGKKHEQRGTRVQPHGSVGSFCQQYQGDRCLNSGTAILPSSLLF